MMRVIATRRAPRIRMDHIKQQISNGVGRDVTVVYRVQNICIDNLSSYAP
jgi:hypothetical protein